MIYHSKKSRCVNDTNKPLQPDAWYYTPFVSNINTKYAPYQPQLSGALNVTMIEFVRVSKNDAQLIFESWGNEERNFRYLTSVVLSDIQLAQEYIDRLYSNRDSFAFHLFKNGSCIGLVKAKIEGHKAQIGYVISSAERGNGYATHAVTFITRELSKMGTIQRIWATCALENIGSSRVLEKCGYVREGVLKNWVVYPALGDMAHDNYSYYRQVNV